MITRYFCPNGRSGPRSIARKRRRCEAEYGRPCRCPGGPISVVDLGRDFKEICDHPDDTVREPDTREGFDRC
jgi:hypothetical protein